MISMLFSMMITLSIMFLWLKHPMSMGFILMLQAVIVALISGMMISNFFFSYIIVIIMLSGALVLFIYMASMASNEKFKTPVNMILLFMVSMLINMIITNNMDTFMYSKNSNLGDGTISLMKLFNSMSSYITMAMILYLLFTMIVVTFIASNKEGPLRMKIYE
uniref:NADH dehydrogenase subunit 6 n=1 Tax=Sphaerocoris annulus TaxID=1277805 RepID=A0A2P1CMS4_9HEMI|nr:NADH dehydrogenase subunit 6 [Sphaerocoris annulus]